LKVIGSVNAEQRQLARYRVCSFAYARHLVRDIVELAGELKVELLLSAQPAIQRSTTD
jgi:hypothetical protein